MSSRNAGDSIVEGIVSSLCEKVDSPKSLAIYLCLKYDHQALLRDIDIDPKTYLTVDSFRSDYLVFSILSKYRGLKTGYDTSAIATDSWKRSESKCSETNKLFRTNANPVKSGLDPVLYRAQMKIASILGSLDVEACLEGGRWGPGATFDIKRTGYLDTKLSKVVTVTPSCLKYGRVVLAMDPTWFESLSGQKPSGPYSVLDSCFSVVPGNRFLTVPKNAKTDRCISAEPTMNGFIQAGVGRYIRSRLDRLGIRLDDQSVNQQLASMAAAERLATIDLSAASDTIARELIWSLLPVDWACFLDDLRSKRTCFKDGSVLTLEKFSSMGNGFTFELETLIFWALAKATLEVSECRDILAVYGDDIIVPQEAADDVVKTLVGCGFTVNTTKSFLSGRFFESCGRHYFDGHDVTPVYQKNLVNSSAEHIRFANRLVRWSMRMTGAWRCREIKSAHRTLMKLYKEFYEPRLDPPAIPVGTLGDAGFLLPLSAFSRFDKNHGYVCRVLVYREETRRARNLAMYAHKLRNPYTTFSYKKGAVVKPTGFGQYVVSHTFVNLHQICEFGDCELEEQLAA